jgi:hypothetical protein
MTTGERHLDDIMKALPDQTTIDRNEGAITSHIKALREAQGEKFPVSVEYKGTTYHKTPSGGWLGGAMGNCGPMTPLGRELEEELAKLRLE